MESYRDELKTRKRYHLGVHFGPKTPLKYWNLIWFKKVLLVILGVPKIPFYSPLNSLICVHYPIIIKDLEEQLLLKDPEEELLLKDPQQAGQIIIGQCTHINEFKGE